MSVDTSAVLMVGAEVTETQFAVPTLRQISSCLRCNHENTIDHYGGNCTECGYVYGKMTEVEYTPLFLAYCERIAKSPRDAYHTLQEYFHILDAYQGYPTYFGKVIARSTQHPDGGEFADVNAEVLSQEILGMRGLLDRLGLPTTPVKVQIHVSYA